MGRYRAALPSVALLALFGCSSGDSVSNPAPSVGEAFVQVSPALNSCPVFDGALVVPRDIPPGVAAQIVVQVRDPGGDSHALTFNWSAALGSFSEPQRSTTAYTCARLGTQSLTLRATDQSGCSSTLLLDVNCVAK